MTADAKAVARRMQEPLEIESTALTPMTMLDRAVASGAGIDVIEKLMGLQERWEGNQARKAFVAAFADFKAEAIQIVRNQAITDGPLKGKKYADLYSFVEAVTPALSKHGLSASWDITKDDKDWIEVTCIIEHVLGHSKRVSLGAAPDAGGAKNAIHARASTVSYLERYTLKAATGLAESGDDDDAAAAANEYVTTEQAIELQELVTKSGANKDTFLEWLRAEEFDKILAKHYARAKKELIEKAAKK